MNELTAQRSKTPSTASRLWTVLVGVLVYAALTAGLYRALAAPDLSAAGGIQIVRGAQPPARNVFVRDGQFLVDGAPFFVNAVGWDPARPGELPWTRTVNAAEVEADFARMKQAGFNTVRTWAPMSPEELSLAEKHGLRVLQGIWVPPDGEFADATFRRKVLSDVARAAESSKWSRSVLGYLVMNEPRAAAVARASVGETKAFFRELIATVRAVDPSALVGYASWPGMEPLHDDGLDFIAFNLYPHRPRVVMDELGLGGYARMLRESIAKGRPFIVSEFGVSVSPHRPEELVARGGATEEEQAEQLAALARTFVGAGAAGVSVFQWNDGWWKDGERQDDALSHDPKDVEEWFGLIAFKGLEDREGTARPALSAMAARQRAVLVEPRDGVQADRAVAVRIFSATAITARVSIDNGSPTELKLHEEGTGWLRGTLSLPEAPGRHLLSFELIKDGQVHREQRLVSTLPPAVSALTITAAPTVSGGKRFSVEVSATGTATKGRSITVAAFTEDRFNEEKKKLILDKKGRAKTTFTAPPGPTLLTLVAFEDDPTVPPVERAVAWTSMEIFGQ